MHPGPDPNPASTSIDLFALLNDLNKPSPAKVPVKTTEPKQRIKTELIQTNNTSGRNEKELNKSNRYSSPVNNQSSFREPIPRFSDQGGVQTTPLDKRVNQKYDISKTKAGIGETQYEKSPLEAEVIPVQIQKK